MVFVGDDLQFWKSVWPDVDGAVVDGVEVAEDTAWTGVHAGQWAVTCPACGMAASRVHSTYGRRLADRPIGGRRVILRLMVRRFLGDNAACKRRTVAEQVEHLTTPYRHRTQAFARWARRSGRPSMRPERGQKSQSCAY